MIPGFNALTALAKTFFLVKETFLGLTLDLGQNIGMVNYRDISTHER